MFLSLPTEGLISSFVVHEVERFLPRAETALLSYLRAADVDKVLDLADSDLVDVVERFLDLLLSALLSFSFLADMIELDCLFLTCNEDTLFSTLLFSLDILFCSFSSFLVSELMEDVRLLTLALLNLDFFSSPVGFLHIGVLVRRLEGGADILQASGVANFDEFKRLLLSG
jgi:hypothetical protein